METKTAKILSVLENQRQYTGQNGSVYIHFITFEGDQHNKAWEYHSTKAVCEKFKVGETTTFDIEIKVNGTYTNYKIKPKQEAGAGFSGRSPKESGRITFLSCVSSASVYFAHTKPSSWSDVLEAAEEAYVRAMAKSSEQ